MNEELNALAEILHSCGWTSPSDAQWTRLEAAIPDIRDALSTPPAAASKQDADREYAAWCMTVDWCDDAESDRCWSAFCAGRESATPPAAVAVPDGMVLVRRKLIDESIARINCAIPGWEVHVHALNDALAAAPAAPSVRAVVGPAGIDRIGLHGFLCEALDDGRCIADAYRFKDGYHTARNAKVMALTDKLLAMLAAAPASPAATGWVIGVDMASGADYSACHNGGCGQVGCIGRCVSSGPSASVDGEG